METYAEGEWKDFIFRRATLEDADEIHELIRTQHIPDEPLSIRLGNSKEYEEDFRTVVRAHLLDDLSFCAFEKSTNKMVAIRISGIETKDDAPMETKSEACNKIFKLIEMMNKESDIYNKYGLNKCANLLIATVHRDFRGQGLATEMYRRSIALARALGFKAMKCCFSSPYSRKAATNAGFKQVAAIEYGKMKDDQGDYFVPNGQPGDLITQSVYIF